MRYFTHDNNDKPIARISPVMLDVTLALRLKQCSNLFSCFSRLDYCYSCYSKFNSDFISAFIDSNSSAPLEVSHTHISFRIFSEERLEKTIEIESAIECYEKCYNVYRPFFLVKTWRRNVTEVTLICPFR